MSARELFFKKVQQQNTIPITEGSVEADIRAFCQRMNELAQQITQWLEGSGVVITQSTVYLSDLSTIGASLNSGASRYAITTLRLQNRDRSVCIVPEQLYRSGEKGCVTLSMNTPESQSPGQQWYLSQAPEGGWFIREEQQAATMKSTLTEDVFFRTIENLA